MKIKDSHPKNITRMNLKKIKKQKIDCVSTKSVQIYCFGIFSFYFTENVSIFPF